MGCHGVKNVWSAKFSSSPSGNSETHTVPHTNTHTYTHAHTTAHREIHSCMHHERHRPYQIHTQRKTHALDRVSMCHSKESQTAHHQKHMHRKTHTVHKMSTFQNTYTVMNTTTKGKNLTCLRTHTHQRLNVSAHYRTCTLIQN